jgi:hypothetical protein
MSTNAVRCTVACGTVLVGALFAVGSISGADGWFDDGGGGAG